MSTSIHWNNIRPFKGSQPKGFEQLCLQVAMKKYETSGTFIEVDDSGGGDGVEFYLVHSNGTEWGWQAKFYVDSPRLKLSGRKEKIIESLKTAIRKHPKLQRWILCTNTQFTPDEQKWFDGQLKKHIPRNRKITLEHWSDGKINRWLDDPAFAGIKQAFFGSLQLSTEWFKAKYDQIKNVPEKKYNHKLHTRDNELYFEHLGPVLINRDFVFRCNDAYHMVEERYKKYLVALEDMKRLDLENIEWTTKNEHDSIQKQFRELAAEKLQQLEQILQLITPNNFSKAQAIDGQAFQQPLIETIKKLISLMDDPPPNIKSEYSPDNEYEEHKTIMALNQILDPVSHADNLIHEINNFFETLAAAGRHHIHLLGDAGIGKTHICISLTWEYLEAGLPVIFIPATKFSEHGTIEKQLLEILDIASKVSFTQFLQTLNSLAKMYNIRIPIIIDGLNESTNDRGTLNTRWKADLPGLESQINSHSNLVLITTCRKSYEKEIWQESEQSNTHTYEGIEYDEDVKELINKYFAEYGIIADLTYLSMSELSHPLLLKIFCETKASKGKKVYLQLGADSIYDIFGEFILKCDQSVANRLKNFGMAPGSKTRSVASTFSKKIGQQLWESNSRLLEFDSYQGLFDEPLNVTFNTSRPKALIDEGLLLMKDLDKNQEHVGFTYDLMAGFCIAGFLIEAYQESLEEFVLSDGFYNQLLSENYELLHPMAEDILECFIALLPPKTGRHLIDILPENPKYKEARNDSFQAFFSISGRYITSREIKRVEKKFDKHPDLRKRLLQSAYEVLFVPNHPLNFQFFSGKLFSLSLIEKDLCFFEFIRDVSDYHRETIVQQFTDNNAPGTHFHITEQELINDLVAEFLVWSLGSNIILYRNRVSKALYIYSCRYPQKYKELLYRMIKADDPYITERLMAVTYGFVNSACQQQLHKSLVIKLASWTYSQFFQSGAPKATTHILTRDYASQLIKVVLRAYPKVNKVIDPLLISRPFSTGGIRNWGTSEDKDKGQYREGNSLLDPHFEKDHLLTLISSKYHERSKKAQEVKGKILWRAYQLGYDFNKFGKIDRFINRWRQNGSDQNKTEKYGSKYTWIAYCELAGYLEDNGQLKSKATANYPVRALVYDFDPTFPEPISERLYFEQDIIGNRKKKINDWLAERTTPNVAPLLVANDLTDGGQHYVLLEAFKVQTDEPAERQVFFGINGIMVEKDQPQAIIRALQHEESTDLIPSVYDRVFSGEYPHSDYFPQFGKRVINVQVKTKKTRQRYVRSALFKGHKQLPAKQENAFWQEMETTYNYDEVGNQGFVRENKDNNGNPAGPIQVIITGDNNEDEDLNHLIEQEMQKRGYHQRIIHKYVLEDQPVTVPLEIFMPVVNWGKQPVIAKEIADALNLNTRPGKTDLYDANGQRASLVFRYGDVYFNNHTFLYLRKDLLHEYLQKTGYCLVFSYQGERNWYLPDDDDNHKVSSKPHWKQFSKIVYYQPATPSPKEKKQEAAVKKRKTKAPGKKKSKTR